MNEKIEYKGLWWLPENEDIKISGTLYFCPENGSKLELIGNFVDSDKDSLTHEFKIILGFSTNGKEITLVDCHTSQSTKSWPGIETISLDAKYLFVGVHFLTIEEMNFRKIYFKLTYLTEWANASGFDLKRISENEISVNYKLPDKVDIYSNSIYDLQLNFHGNWPLFLRSHSKFQIQQEPFFAIEFSIDVSLEYVLTQLRQIQNILSLAVTEFVYPIFLKGYSENNKGKYKESDYMIPIDIYFLNRISSEDKSKISTNEMLFTFSEISAIITKIFNNWFAKGELLQPVYELYFSIYRSPSMYLQNQFLSLVFAVETYHRRVFENRELDSDAHSERINTILISCPDEHQKWLESKLQYSNEPPLRTRLKELFNLYFDLFTFSKSELKSITNKIVSTRNFRTHFNPSLKAKSAEGRDLLRITYALNKLLTSCILNELGFEHNEIQKILSKNIKFTDIKN